MADLSKVLKGFEHCMMESDGIQDNPCVDCPYLSKPGCSTTLKQDAVDLLKAQQERIDNMVSLLGEADREKERLKLQEQELKAIIERQKMYQHW